MRRTLAFGLALTLGLGACTDSRPLTPVSPASTPMRHVTLHNVNADDPPPVAS